MTTNKKRNRPERRKPTFGSISSGTMRPEDLIPSFLRELEYYAPREAARICKEYGYDNVAFGLDSEYADFLFDALNEVASRVPYMYFGPHAGDASDYGFWLLEDLTPYVSPQGNTP